MPPLLLRREHYSEAGASNATALSVKLTPVSLTPLLTVAEAEAGASQLGGLTARTLKTP